MERLDCPTTLWNHRCYADDGDEHDDDTPVVVVVVVVVHSDCC